MASKQNSDLELINEVKMLIDEVIDKVPEKKDMGMVNLRSLIVFSLGGIIGFGMFVLNLIMTSIVMLSVILLGFFFILGFLIGMYIEKVDSLNKASNPLYAYY